MSQLLRVINDLIGLRFCAHRYGWPWRDTGAQRDMQTCSKCGTIRVSKIQF